jgi:hypothetical protein
MINIRTPDGVRGSSTPFQGAALGLAFIARRTQKNAHAGLISMHASGVHKTPNSGILGSDQRPDRRGR